MICLWISWDFRTVIFDPDSNWIIRDQISKWIKIFNSRKLVSGSKSDSCDYVSSREFGSKIESFWAHFPNPITKNHFDKWIKIWFTWTCLTPRFFLTISIAKSQILIGLSSKSKAEELEGSKNLKKTTMKTRFQPNAVRGLLVFLLYFLTKSIVRMVNPMYLVPRPFKQWHFESLYS